jgi:hypothetical protein
MTHEAPIAMSDPCVYNPTHMLPWVGLEDASRNIGNNMMKVCATLEGGGFSNCAFASDHSLRLACYAETIRGAAARLGNRPIAASASAVAAESVQNEAIINNYDNDNSDSDSDKTPPAIVTKKKSVHKVQATPKKNPAPRKEISQNSQCGR